MRDGRTRKLPAAGTPADLEGYLRRHRALLVVEKGGAAGAEYPLAAPRVAIGRGPGVDLAFPDPAMSRQHLCVEFGDGRWRVRDLGSTNGIAVNGASVEAAELKHGDRLRVGQHEFRLLEEAREARTPTHHLPDA